MSPACVASKARTFAFNHTGSTLGEVLGTSDGGYIFCKTICSFRNKGTQKVQKTNHYILLTNVIIKRCIRPGSQPCSSGGGEEFQPDKYLTDNNSC